MLQQYIRVTSLSLPLISLCVVLASCDDDDRGCFGCGNITPTEFSNGVVSADFNGDGFADVVALSTVQPAVSPTPSNIKAYLSTAAGVFAAPVATADGFNPLYIANADINGDALMDVFTASTNEGALDDLVISAPGATGGMATAVYVLIQNPASHGAFLAPVGYPIATQDRPQSIQLRDLQGTGKLDIIIGGQKFVTVLLHDPANPGKFLPANIYPAPGANEIAIADINGDGKLDIVVSNGVTFPMQGGVATTHPGVLLQSADASGTFGALQDLP